MAVAEISLATEVGPRQTLKICLLGQQHTLHNESDSHRDIVQRRISMTYHNDPVQCKRRRSKASPVTRETFIRVLIYSSVALEASIHIEVDHRLRDWSRSLRHVAVTYRAVKLSCNNVPSMRE